MLNQSIKVLQY